MNKILRIVFTASVILAFIAIVWIVLMLNLFSGVQPYIPDPVYTADRSRVIIPSINYNKEDHVDYLQIYFEIRDAKSGETLFQTQTDASDRMKWSIGWIGNSMVLLNSSDVGIYCWEEGNEGAWMKTACTQ